MARRFRFHRSLIAAIPLAGAAACASADEATSAFNGGLLPSPGRDTLSTTAPTAPSRAELKPAAGVEVQYELLAPPATATTPGPGRLLGSVDVGQGRLRSSVRFDPAAERRFGSPDANWELHAPGPLQTVVIGDTYASGGGWSAPARLTGGRFGRALALRAPRSLPDAPKLAAPAFAAVSEQPPRLDAGASDYEVAFGRLRSGWDSTERIYQSAYGAAAYRAGLGGGVTAEARSEWTGLANVHGLEVAQALGSAGTVQAVLAQSAGPAGNGVRWGMGVVRNAEGATWTLDYDAAESGYATVLGAREARAGVRAGAKLAVAQGVSTELSFQRRANWDTSTPDTAVNLGTQLDLASQAKLSLNLSVRDGMQPGWGAAMTLSVPLDSRR